MVSPKTPGQPILQFEVLAASVIVRQSNGEVTLTGWVKPDVAAPTPGKLLAMV